MSKKLNKQISKAAENAPGGEQAAKTEAMRSNQFFSVLVFPVCFYIRWQFKLGAEEDAVRNTLIDSILINVAFYLFEYLYQRIQSRTNRFILSFLSATAIYYFGYLAIIFIKNAVG